MMKIATLAIAAALLLVACKREDPQAAARAAAAQAQAREQAATAMEKQFEDAVAAQNWRLAKGYGEVLQIDHPTSAAAARVKPRLDDIRAKAEAEVLQQRLAALWSYGDEPVGKDGHQLSASIYSQEPVDTDGGGAHPVRLIFRDHPDWGRSSYLVLQAGDFAKACYGKCSVTVTIDDAPPRKMAANRPKTDEAIAMFIDDNRGLWRQARKAKAIQIEFPVQAGGTRSVVFETGGLDGGQMPGWD